MKRLVDIDDSALARAREALGLPTIKATVNASLRMAAAGAPQPDADAIDAALEALGAVDFDDRTAAWR